MSYQQDVRTWVEHTFGIEVANDIPTRCFRFFEEAGELCQSLGMSKDDAMKLVNYTWGRPVGEPAQELGGVMVTLAALATPAGLNMEMAARTELSRCWLNVEKIRAKQLAKKALGLGTSPLPGSADLGKYVTLYMALKVQSLREGELVWWLPQQSVWRIVADEGMNWACESVDTMYAGIFALPKDHCSEPRNTEAA